MSTLPPGLAAPGLNLPLAIGPLLFIEAPMFGTTAGGNVVLLTGLGLLPPSSAGTPLASP
jgi:hypothetical protein